MVFFLIYSILINMAARDYKLFQMVIIVLLLVCILGSLGYLGREVFSIREGLRLMDSMHRLDWGNDGAVDRVVHQFHPRHHRFLTRMLTSGDYEHRFYAAYVLIRSGEPQYAQSMYLGLKSEDSRERLMAYTLLRSYWFNASGVDARQGLRKIQAIMARGKFEEAIRQLTLLVKQYPQFAEAYNQRGLAYYLKGDYSRALNDCRIAMMLNPAHFGAAAGIGDCYYKLRQWQSAESAYVDTLKIVPYSLEVQVALEKVRRLQRAKRLKMA